MRIKSLAAIAIAAVVAGTGLAVYSVGSLPPEKQSTPAAAQLATLLAESVDPFLHRSGRPAVRIWKVIFCGRVNVGMRRMNRRFESNRHSDYR